MVSCMAYSSVLKMEATCSFETSIDCYRTTRRRMPEGRTPQCDNSLKCRLIIYDIPRTACSSEGTRAVWPPMSVREKPSLTEVFCATKFSYVFVIFLQIVWRGRSEIRTKEMDSLLRRRNGDHFLCGHVRVRSGLTRRRDHGKYTCCLHASLLLCLPMKCVSIFNNSSLNMVIPSFPSALQLRVSFGPLNNLPSFIRGWLAGFWTI
jgi:hypothetical protein